LLPSKDDCKISGSFEQIRNFKVSHFSMAKVIKVNIAVPYQPEQRKAKNNNPWSNICRKGFEPTYSMEFRKRLNSGELQLCPSILD
jgi:hypothetical protein